MIRELRTLMAVAREGTFAAAGARVGLTQAAVSAQMGRLERELGFALFDRGGRTARLNDMGRQVLAQAQELLRLHDSLGVTPQSGAAQLVVVGSIASMQRSLLPDALALFHHRHPACRTRVVPGVSMALMNLVDAGEIDMAVIIRPPFALQSDLRWTTLAREPFRLLVPAGMAGEDWAALLASQPFVRYDRASFGGRQVDRFLRGMHCQVREVCEVDELDAIVALVANGVGVALVPETPALPSWPRTVRAIGLGTATFHREIGLLQRASEPESGPAAALAALILARSDAAGACALG